MFGCALLPAKAVFMLPAPEMKSETMSDGKVEFTWECNTDEKITNYHVIVYKIHKATAEETFTLAQSDFDYIESTGTMKKHEDRGAIWDYLPDCPGWYAKTPLYMNGALGLDTFNQFAGSDNSDIFGGVYLLSPDYDVTDLTDRKLYVSCSLGNEATSVTGGFALYTWSDDWWNEANYDYKPVEGHDHHYTTLSSDSFQDFEEACEPQIFLDRTRISFYGSGYSALWIDKFKVDVKMAPGDKVRYAADLHVLEAKPGENSFSIDLSGDDENDYVYGYQLRTVRMDVDDYRKVTTVRFLSPFTAMHKLGDEFVAIEDVAADASEAVEIAVREGSIFVEAEEGTPVEVFTPAGQKVMDGVAGQALNPGNGIFIVKAGNTSAKVVL